MATENEGRASGRSGSAHDHSSHEHHDHAGHDHEGHDYHSGHDHAAHDDHSGHGHDDHAGHDHTAHAAHDDHSGHAHADRHDHDDHSGHDHAGHDHAGHDHAHDLREAGRRNLVISLALIGGYMIAEIIGGLISGSLALLADAAHMFTDAAAIGLALFAMWMANRPASVERTFGFHRTEILAALVNALSLWLIAGWIFYEAYHRFTEPPEVQGLLMLSVGGVGLLVNIVVVLILHRSSGHSINVEAAFWHVVADLLGSIGVMISGLLVTLFGWWVADPILRGCVTNGFKRVGGV